MPPGTDLLVRLKDNVPLPEELAATVAPPGLQDDEQQNIAEVLGQLPTRTLDKKSRAADLINMVFVGTREEFLQGVPGFRLEAERLCFLAIRRASIPLLPRKIELPHCAHVPPTLRWTPARSDSGKNFDSYSKRDHLRIWKLESTMDDQPVWVGAAVRETGATLSVIHVGFVHHVSDDLAGEERAIQRDLLAADCVDSAGKVERPGMDKAVINATGEVLRTDGSVMVLRVKACGAPSDSDLNDPRFRPGSKFSRYLRKEILTVRSDLLRANSIYAMFRVTVATTRTFRQMSARRADVR